MYYYNIDNDYEDNIIWERKEKIEPINATIDIVIHPNSITDVENVINELLSKLKNVKIGLTLN